jgi:hypothetical protein
VVIVAVVLTAAAVGLNTLVMGPAVILLNIGLAASLLAWLASGAGRLFPQPLLGPFFLVSIAVHTLHFAEEYAGRLYQLVPPMFDLAPLPSRQFAVFNLIWIGIFFVSAVGVFRRVRLALLPVWFMALIGGFGNAVIHSWISVRVGGYVPGLITSLVNLPLGITLVIMLVRPGPPERTIDDHFRSTGGSEPDLCDNHVSGMMSG